MNNYYTYIMPVAKVGNFDNKITSLNRNLLSNQYIATCIHGDFLSQFATHRQSFHMAHPQFAIICV